MSEPALNLLPLPGIPVGAGTDCWNRIGISGDQTCPELKGHIHCRNCPVFTAAARTFFDRPAPANYVAEWARWLAGANGGANDASRSNANQDDRDLISVLIFRLGREWLAFTTSTVDEVTLPRPVHKIPHRSSPTLLGLVNLRGSLSLCVSLHALLGVERVTALPPDPKSDSSSLARRTAGPETGALAGLTTSPGSHLVVLRDRARSESWLFPVEELLGVHRLARSQMRSISSSLANPEVSFSQAILSWNDRSVGFLDEQRVFAALRSTGQ
jgi:chemotaxis-related protein WspD